jgi:hypothetical protein
MAEQYLREKCNEKYPTLVISIDGKTRGEFLPPTDTL